MVGSVLMQRMQAERDFDLIEPVVFHHVAGGGNGPAIGKATAAAEGRDTTSTSSTRWTC